MRAALIPPVASVDRSLTRLPRLAKDLMHVYTCMWWVGQEFTRAESVDEGGGGEACATVVMHILRSCSVYGTHYVKK